ncbi:MAG: hypothetical protein WAO58_11330 [Fimbriimonadaceae bacterium]
MSNTYRTWAICLAAVILAVGCGSNEAADTAAINAAHVNASSDYERVTSATQKLSQLSSEDDLMAAKASVQEIGGKLRALVQIGEAERAQITTLESEVKRLDAAVTLGRAKLKWEGLLAEARFSPKDAKASLAERRAILREQWPEFRQADDDLMAAERAYTAAQSRLAADMQRAKSLSALPRM